MNLHQGVNSRKRIRAVDKHSLCDTILQEYVNYRAHMKTLPCSSHLFPCPICGEALDVRKSKRNKPYVVCDRCGMQLFVRTRAGIQKFEALVSQAAAENIWERLRSLAKHYQRKCPKCGKTFWIREELIATSWFDGSVTGYRCPESDCDGIARQDDMS